MLLTTLTGRISYVEKKDINENRVVYNLGIAVHEGFGDNEKVYFYDADVFSNRGKQEDYYDKVLVKGNKLPFTGRIVPETPYEKQGVKIKPYIFHITQVGYGINQAIVTGNLTDDAIVTVNDDLVIVRFTIGIRRLKGGDSDFVRIVKFGKGGFADYAKEWLKKGQAVLVMGREQTGSYTNKDNVKIYTQEINASVLELIGPKSNSEIENTNIDEGGFISIPEDDNDPELPFS